MFPQIHVWTTCLQLVARCGDGTTLWWCNHWNTKSSKQEWGHWRWGFVVISELSTRWASKTLQSCVGSLNSHTGHLAFLSWWTEPFETASQTNLSSSKLLIRYFFSQQRKKQSYNILVPVPLKRLPTLVRRLFFSSKRIYNPRVMLQTIGVWFGPKSVKDGLASDLRGEAAFWEVLGWLCL